MGCTSSKATRSTSIEAITQKDEEEEQPRQQQSNGGPHHMSFLAPDGIPFIDEDLDDLKRSVHTQHVQINQVSHMKDFSQMNDAKQINVCDMNDVSQVNHAINNEAGNAVVEDTTHHHEEARKAARTHKQMSEQEAAIKIQAGVRGFVGRQRFRRKIQQQESSPSTQEELAATKIQARFRGYQTRKHIHK